MKASVFAVRHVGHPPRPTYTVATVVLALLLCAVPTAHAQDFSLRAAAFNTFMKPSSGGIFCAPGGMCATMFPKSWNGHLWLPGGCAGGGDACELFGHVYNDAELQAGAVEIAARIRRGGYDFVVLVEVFDEGVREELIARLEPEYPNILVKADAPGDAVQDSGLMLFAKPHLEITESDGLAACGGEAEPRGAGWLVATRSPLSGDCTFDSRSPTPCGPFASFREYGAHATAFHGDDGSIANKGVAFVQLQDTTNGLRHGVFFTHTQAFYADRWFDPEDQAEDEIFEMPSFDWHKEELLVVKELVECLESHSTINREFDHIYLMGDLNIDGNPGASLNSIFGAPVDNRGEWTFFFNSNSWENGFFSDLFMDAWVHEAPWSDRGLTSGSTRIDYILHHQPTTTDPDFKLCNQHMSLAYNLRDYEGATYHGWEGGMDHGGRGPTLGDGLRGYQPSSKFSSDHLGVNANYNRCTPQCSPLDPFDAFTLYGDTALGGRVLQHHEIGNTPTGDPLLPDPNNPNAGETPLNGALELVGALDWHRLDHEGQYFIGLAQSSLDQGFRLSVYHESNMSEPMKNMRDEKYTWSDFADQDDVVGVKYVLLHPPYYIKIYNLSHAQTGPYMLAVQRLNCSDKYMRACEMLPNQYNGRYLFPPNQLVISLPTPDSMYFRFDMQKPLDPAATQTLRTVVSNYDKNILAAFIVDPHEDTTLMQFEPSVGADLPLQNTFHAERALMNGFANSDQPFPDSWPACPASGAPGPMGFLHFPQCNNVIRMDEVAAPSNDKGRRLFLRISRADITGQPLASCGTCDQVRFEPTWQTELTVLPVVKEIPQELQLSFPDHSLTCNDQSDPTSTRDEMRMRLGFDGVWFAGYAPEAWTKKSLGHPSGICDEFDAFWVSHMDDGEHSKQVVTLSEPIWRPRVAGYPNASPLRFTSNLQVDVVEEDDCPSYPDPPVNGPEVGTDSFPPLSIDRFTPGSGWFPDTRTVVVPGGEYVVSLSFMHGTQPWEEPFDEGDLALDCVVSGSCTLAATAAASPSQEKENAVDNLAWTYYQSISTSSAYWQAWLASPTFVGKVRIEGMWFDDTCVGASQDGSSWHDWCVGAYPSGQLDVDVGMPARYVRIMKTVPGVIRVASFQIYGY